MGSQNKKPVARQAFYFVNLSKQTALLASGNRKAFPCFEDLLIRQNRKRCTESVRFEKRTRGLTASANKKSPKARGFFISPQTPRTADSRRLENQKFFR